MGGVEPIVTDTAAQVYFQGGRLYVTRAAYDAFLAPSTTVVLLRRDADLLGLPVQNAASGGYVLKIRNAAGDRVVSAADFFRDQGVEDDAEWRGSFAWCNTYHGLRMYGFFRV